MSSSLLKRLRNNRGTTAIEYGLMAAGIAAVTMVAVGNVGAYAKTTYCTVAGAVSGTGSCSNAYDQKAQNSKITTSQLYKLYGGLPAGQILVAGGTFTSNGMTRNQGFYNDPSSITSLSGLKDADGNAITNRAQLFSAMGQSDLYNQYQTDLSNYKASFKAWGDIGYAYGTSQFNAQQSDWNNLNNIESSLTNAILNNTSPIYTTGDNISVNYLDGTSNSYSYSADAKNNNFSVNAGVSGGLGYSYTNYLSSTGQTLSTQTPTSNYK